MPGNSYLYYKEEVCQKLMELCPQGSTALDIGAGAGIYAVFLNRHYVMDAIEIWAPTIESENLKEKYRNIYCGDALDFKFTNCYDLIILGDIVEHLDVDDAQRLIKDCLQNATYVMIAVPYNLPQGPIYGNRHECHRQSDLTKEIFNQRYPGFTRIFGDTFYGYYLNKPQT